MVQESTSVSKSNQQQYLEPVMNQIQKFQLDKKLEVPEDYSVVNALQKAWLMIQEAVDKDKRPALDVCTPVSIRNALLDMVVMGLSPQKDQCYFIVYGRRLVCMPSYFADMMLCKKVAGAADVSAQVVYEGDKVTYQIWHGRKVNLNHLQNPDNIDDKKIKGAYCAVTFPNGAIFYEYMTMAEIRQSWTKAKSLQTHNEFPGEMAKKTVIRRACKSYINSSSDDTLFKTSYNRASDDATIEEEYVEELREENTLELETITHPVATEEVESVTTTTEGEMVIVEMETEQVTEEQVEVPLPRPYQSKAPF